MFDSPPIITLTTDFGRDSHYVAQMKGAILAISPRVRIVDLSHSIPPQDVHTAAWVLNETIDAFPVGTIHLAVVDPGVGSDRTMIAGNTQDHYFVAPNNGLLTRVLDRCDRIEIVQLTNDRFWRSDVSPTFHGRDIMGPVAAHLSTGIALESLGPRLNSAQRVESTQPVVSDVVSGRVEFVDSFGNLITNIRLVDVKRLTVRSRLTREDAVWTASIEHHVVHRLSRCYADVAEGELLALFGSSGRLEFAIAGGNAARRLKLGTGAGVRVWPRNALRADS